MRRKDDIELVSVRDIKDLVEFNILKEALKDNNIPFIVRDEGSGSYMRIIGGFSSLPFEILVSKEDLPKAEEVIHNIFSGDF